MMHIAGVVLHALRHRDGIAMTMIDGEKKDIPVAEVISNSRPGVALLFVGLVFIFATYLAGNFDSLNRTLNFLVQACNWAKTKKPKKKAKKVFSESMIQTKKMKVWKMATTISEGFCATT
ncbi:MAG: hypothetical protein IPK68_22995 [Bdellovibrionales bacterium]|nr:hypothetical protein [Bdellovibrionales bacterium]